MRDTLPAPAKINVWLRIFAPDATGYHPLDTLFCAIDLADRITIHSTAEATVLDVLHADVGPLERNLARRAADEFFRASGLKGGAAIRLEKAIPAGAGLGGGSSDAAAVLLALNELHGQPLSDAALHEIAGRLGSDVAFFLCGSSLAHATGRGDVVRALPPLPRAPMIIVVPQFGISTADAYRWLDESGGFSEPVAPADPPRDWAALEPLAHNAFEPVVFERHPVLADYKARLLDSGARIALLSGSGSTLFAVYASDAERDGALTRLAGTVRASQAAIISTDSRVVQRQDSGLWLR